MLNAFRHLRYSHPHDLDTFPERIDVLNAFRHLRYPHLSRTQEAVETTGCSTPCGI